MQISSSNSNLYSDIYSQQNSTSYTKDNSLENLKQDMQNSNQYKTVSTNVEERNSKVERGDRLLEITETKKTVEKHKIDIYA